MARSYLEEASSILAHLGTIYQKSPLQQSWFKCRNCSWGTIIRSDNVHTRSLFRQQLSRFSYFKMAVSKALLSLLSFSFAQVALAGPSITQQRARDDVSIGEALEFFQQRHNTTSNLARSSDTTYWPGLSVLGKRAIVPGAGALLCNKDTQCTDGR